MTNILQPLDVAVNQNYQEFYSVRYDDYLSRALSDPSLQTKAGNPKVPRCATVAQWTLDWVASKDTSRIKRAFTLCGLLRKQYCSMEALCLPVRDLLVVDVDMNRWNELYCDPADSDDRMQLDIAAP
ncbi:hypothetical protein JG687_00016106 [Phytophthora cactorum]|uniref:Uncharacterized protein n=1 Tax=Phytophthora cactorum TaxID=29920 RepID=A0A8T1TV86_9STRA|nr:hypothetical protein PC120_g22115 [Phytophthora cactorum]KAG4041929.1 hypothetical protein PC123_g22565 [Phytophthora cactorum]KAG6947411.1 hypothetical protein JG687_00016106 [Phytophthora cactorum]